jgi:hypothetical protein
MVERASINRKEAQIHNEVTFYCGFDKEIGGTDRVIAVIP